MEWWQICLGVLFLGVVIVIAIARLILPPDVKGLKAKGNVKGLIRALSYRRDDVIPRKAVMALGDVGDVRAVKPLIAALKDNSLRGLAAEALGKIGDVRAVKPLIAAYKNDSTSWYVVRALHKIGMPAVEPLIAALKGGDSNIRKGAAEVLSLLNWEPQDDETGAVYWINKGEFERCAAIGEPAVEPLIDAFKDGNWQIREKAANILGRLNWKPQDDETGVLYWLTKGEFERCAAIGEPAVEPLIAVLKNGDDYGHEVVAKAAAKALGEIGDARAVESLIARLHHRNFTMRKTAAESLLKLYLSNRLDEKHKMLILSQRGTITKEHYDGYHSFHNDHQASYDDQMGGGYSYDSESHLDSGIGVDFP